MPVSASQLRKRRKFTPEVVDIRILDASLGMVTMRFALRALACVVTMGCQYHQPESAQLAAKPVHHYVFFSQDRERIAGDSLFFGTKALEGAQVTYTWRQLEPAKDQYDFSLIREDLALLTPRGKKLWIQIQDVTFDSTRINIPRYLLNDTIYHGGAAQKINDRVPEAVAPHGGWVARRWDPAVQDRLHRLFAALGREFDGRIEGVNLDETSIGFGTTGRHWPAGFTPEIYRDAVITNMKALKNAFPRSVAMQYGNFMPGEWRPSEDKGYLRSVYDAAKQFGVGMGGPDLLPFRKGQLRSSYPLLREVSGVVPTGIAVQDGNFTEDLNPATGKRVTVPELIDFAANNLRVKYIFWGTEEPFYSSEIVPYLRGSMKH
jgi:hypothetical protein